MNAEFDRAPRFFDWAEFTAAHVLRAADVLHALSEYGVRIQNITHNSNPAGLILQSSGGGWTLVAPNEVWIGYLLGAAVIWAVAYREGHATVAELKAAVLTPPEAEPAGEPV